MKINVTKLVILNTDQNAKNKSYANYKLVKNR